MKCLYVNKIMIRQFDEPSCLSNLPAIKWLLKSETLGLITSLRFFTGENGTGKSTIVEAIAICAGFNAEGGSKNFDFSTKQTSSNLHKYLTLQKPRTKRTAFFARRKFL